MLRTLIQKWQSLVTMTANFFLLIMIFFCMLNSDSAQELFSMQTVFTSCHIWHEIKSNCFSTVNSIQNGLTLCSLNIP